jgi:hypothetical protein
MITWREEGVRAFLRHVFVSTDRSSHHARQRCKEAVLSLALADKRR